MANLVLFEMRRFFVKRSAFAVVLSAVLVVTFVTLLPMCNLLFSCGCTFSGLGHCNVHHATAPRCPWCANGNGAFVVCYGLSILGIAASIFTSLKFRPTRARRVVAFAAGVIAYVITLSLAGLATALYFHYPTWYGMHL